jgi:homocysteine S-methyltransferase
MLAAHLARYVERGVQIVGGCCGSTPEHVAAIARGVKG